MKRVYLVKKNPELPTGDDNWIVMSWQEYAAFMKTPEGQRRKKDFAQLDACDENDTIIVAECGRERAKRWYAECNHNRYVRDSKMESGYIVFSYNSLTTKSGEEIAGEDILKDDRVDVEEDVIKKMMGEKLHRMVSILPEEEQDLIEKLYLSDEPMTEPEYAKSRGITRNLVHCRRRHALQTLRLVVR